MTSQISANVSGHEWADDGGNGVGGDGEDVANWAEVFSGDAGAGGLDAELAAGAPWVPVTPGEVAGLVQAYRWARALAAVVRLVLDVAGIGRADVAICASVDGAGRALVVVSVADGRDRGDVARILGCLGGRVVCRDDHAA